MPRINIVEEELKTFATFDATENAVVVPLFVTEESVGTKRYTSKAAFTSDWPIKFDTTGLPAADNKICYWLTNYEEKYVPAEYASDGVTPITPASTTIEKGELTFDKSWVMICDLLTAGLPVVVKPIVYEGDSEGSGRFDSENALIEELIERVKGDTDTPSVYDEFKNKNLWNIKFLTCGAYNAVVGGDVGEGAVSLVGAGDAMAEIVAERGDAIAVIDLQKKLPPTKEEKTEGISYSLEELSGISVSDNYKYVNIMYPWGNYSMSNGIKHTETKVTCDMRVLDMPATFGWLLAMASNIKSNADWFATAGTIRGQVPNLNAPLYNVSESLMHNIQGDDGTTSNFGYYINPIMQVGSYGIRIWGNRTAYKQSELDLYSKFLNVRMLLCDIKKQIYHSSLRITFEPNDDIAWINFKKLNNTLLDRMQSGRGIQWYRWNKLVTDAKATLKAVLTIKPIEALEYFDITVSLAEDGNVSVNEEQTV